MIVELSPRTFWIVAREFSSFEAARGPLTGQPTLIPDTVLSVHSSDVRPRFSAVASRRTDLQVPVVRRAVSTRSSGGCF
jgi:hypothetical protein